MVDVRTNLLKNRRTVSEKDYQRERMLLRYAVFGLVIVVVIAIALSIWNLVLTRKLTGIEQSITTASKEMQGLTQASAQQVYLKSRLKLITSFLSERSLTREALQKILSTNIESTHVSGVAFEDETTLSVEYASDNNYALEQLLSYYQTDTGYFTQAVSRGISRNKNGEYQLSLDLALPKVSK